MRGTGPDERATGTAVRSSPGAVPVDPRPVGAGPAGAVGPAPVDGLAAPGSPVLRSGARGARDPLVIGGLVAAATVYVALVDPNRPGHYLFCPLLALTGLYCPACGGLRSTHAMTRFDLAGAWSANALWTVLAPVLVVAWGAWLLRAWRGRARRWSVPMWVPPALLAVVVVFGVLRNVPALAALAP
ncbi:hypothetical protein GCM10025865_28320 [Paraoerskovia sediminicola]|uniref:DUF2752 domain-containing protein n=1 Tax=Paraoerskovia sediminicola TaxID=1138587 RepID=A0ABM8G5V4_9CELL|nr:DUF2752 domain-containing protein [Paraoerskovia sediminicola]BDZ43533.1 hypothetical protein GCM10025865_28320 [Paraoerskovia sediminicola]